MNAPSTNKAVNRWNHAKLGELITVIRGVSYKKEHASGEPTPDHVPILRATNIQGSLLFEDLVYVPQSYVSEGQFLQKGDIVVAASSGSRNIVGKAAQLTMDWRGSFGTFCFGLRPKVGVNSRYLAWFLQTSEYRNRVSELSAGVNINNLKAAHIEQIVIPVAPENEQHRIVAEIEKQFTRLDAGVAALRRVQANLKHYRAAVLKAACEGKLVPTEAELRKAEGSRRKDETRRAKPADSISSFIPHPSSFESGEQLLQRILAERRKNWTGRGKYKEPAAADTADLPPLPEGWTWATFGQLCRVQGGFAFKSIDYVKEGVPLVRISNLVNGRIQVSDDTVFLPPSFVEANPQFLLRRGDVLIAMSGATTGKMATMNEDIPALLNQRVGRFVLSSSELSNVKFISFLVMQISAKVLKGAYGAAQPNISPAQIEEMRVPLPPLAEQTRIVEEVERRLSVLEELESLVSVNLQRAVRLRQSILQKAFAAELVPQNSDDEPADVLLRRVKDVSEPKLAKKKAKPKDQTIMPSKPVTTLEELLQRLDSIGGVAAPDRLLAASGLGDDVETFFDLLREGRNIGALIVPMGTSGDIKRSDHEN